MSLDDERALRTRTTWFVAAAYLIFALLGVGVVFLARTWKEAALGAGSAVASSILAIRAARAGITIDEGGITARADRFTRRMRWDEVERFEVRRRWSGSVWAKTTSGKSVKLLDGGLPDKGTARAIARQLEVKRERHDR